MKPTLIFAALLISINGLAQREILNYNECQLFDYLQVLSSNDYRNPNYYELKRNLRNRNDLLIKLEEYLNVFRSDNIRPMHLENPRNPKSCPEFTDEYIRRKNENKIKSKNDRLSNNELRKAVQEGQERNIYFLMLDLSGLLEEDEAQNVEVYIAEFKKSYTLESLYDTYKDTYVKPCKDNTYADRTNYSIECLSRLTYESNLQKIQERINIIDNNSYSFYESNHSKPNMIKGFEGQHGNDFLLLGFGDNQDREMTGSFKFSITTDYLKWRFFKSGGYPEKVISYQSISLGGTGYTPYIRYRNNSTLADSIHIHDRPFGSYAYIERAKYRTWRKGLVRQRGEFQIGSIGISGGRKIQAKLHEDVNHKSQFVHGWDNQIGDGGRLVFQFNQKVDLLLMSSNNNYFSFVNYKKRYVEEKNNYFGSNLILESDFRLGGYYTSWGFGLRYSTLDFLKQSGTNQILPMPGCKSEFGWKFDFGFNYRRVIHNTMLQGLGYFKTHPQDNYDQVSQDPYTLTEDQIQKNLFIVDFGLNFRWRKSTLYYRLTFQSLEYKPQLENFNFQDSKLLDKIDPDDMCFYNTKVIKEQKSFLDKKWFGGQTYYGYGTLGMSWIIE